MKASEIEFTMSNSQKNLLIIVTEEVESFINTILFLRSLIFCWDYWHQHFYHQWWRQTLCNGYSRETIYSSNEKDCRYLSSYEQPLHYMFHRGVLPSHILTPVILQWYQVVRKPHFCTRKNCFSFIELLAKSHTFNILFLVSGSRSTSVENICRSKTLVAFLCDSFGWIIDATAVSALPARLCHSGG